MGSGGATLATEAQPREVGGRRSGERPDDAARGPVFIVGCPRSGTTILQNVLRIHPDVAWVTPGTNAFSGFFADRGLDPAPAFPIARVLDPVARRLPRSVLPKFLEGPEDVDLHDGLPPTEEGSRIWIRSVPDRDHDRLTAEDVEPGAREHYRRVVRLHLDHFGAERFLSKFPVNVLRIPWLQELFPEGHFIHLLRDGRAASASIAQRRSSGDGRPTDGWFGPRPPGWRDLGDEPLPVQAGWLWRTTVEYAEDDAAELLPDDRFTRVRYEDLTEEPEAEMQRILGRVDLEREDVMGELEPFLADLENRNWKWRERFSEEELELLMGEIRDAMQEHGYLGD